MEVTGQRVMKYNIEKDRTYFIRIKEGGLVSESLLQTTPTTTWMTLLLSHDAQGYCSNTEMANG